MDDGLQDPLHNPIEHSRRWRGLQTDQWVVLALLGGLLLAIVATLILVIRSGTAGPALPDLTVTDAYPDSTPWPYASEIVSPSLDLYWPSSPQPLAPPDAPGHRLWWDTRFAYRRAVQLDAIAQRAPAGTWAEVLWDGDAAVRTGEARRDGGDVRIVYWDGQWGRELARTLVSNAGEPGWRISFALVDRDDEAGRYHLYYGRPAAEAGDAPVSTAGDLAEHALVLALDAQESVEWGPTVTWTAHSTVPQTLVSPDGRLVLEHPAGGLSQDTRVRLRIVPGSERGGFGPLPEYELHADPPPGGPEAGHLSRWDPPITVSINWAGLSGITSSPTWAHFRHETTAGTWEPVPIEFDAETGILRFTTDQP